MMKIFFLPWLVLAIMVVVTLTAFGQTVVVTDPETSEIVVPWGQWISDISASLIHIVAALVLAGLGWVSRYVPWYFSWILQTKIAEQWLSAAIERGINSVAGASKDKKLTLDVGSVVVARSSQYMIDEAPKWLVDWLGGASGIQQRILTRLDLEDAAAVDVSTGALTSFLSHSAPVMSAMAGTTAPSGTSTRQRRGPSESR